MMWMLLQLEMLKNSIKFKEKCDILDKKKDEPK